MRPVSDQRCFLRYACWILFFFLGLLFGPTATSWADDAEIYRQLDVLKGRNTKQRQAAIQALGKTGDARLAKFFRSYTEGTVYLWNEQDRIVICDEFIKRGDRNLAPLLDPLTREPLKDGQEVNPDSLEELGPATRERRVVANILRFLEDFGSPDEKKRLAAVQRFGNSRDPVFLDPLQEVAKSDSSKKVRNAAHESALLIRISGNLRSQKTADRRKAAEGLQEVRSLRGSSVMKDMLKRGKLSKDLRAAFTTAVESIDKYHYWVRKVQDIVNGISLGSILVLMALGLAIIFGQMGVINMAHGELMMVGAYAAYEMQELFGHRPPDDPNDWYFVAAFPVAFLAAGLVGYLIERLVVRHLYGRPLDTLLATWGIGLILIQTARVRYGDNIGLSSPETLVGGMEPITGLVLGYGRFFVVIMAAACVLAIHVLFKYTRSGLLIRATVQNRDTANSLGVNTRRVDGLTFALGSGLAGIAGCSLICVYGSVTPDMGQNFIVDSFLVVVTGGVGELAGAVWAGLGLGVINKFVEPLFSQNGVIWAKVLILLTVVMFIQWRPAGLFPPKGRLADD